MQVRYQRGMLLIRIRPSIAWYRVRHCVRWSMILGISLIWLYQWFQYLPISVRSAYRNSMRNPKLYLAWVIVMFADQLKLCQCRMWLVSSYRIQVWCCTAFYLKLMSRVPSGLFSCGNIILPSATSCSGLDYSRRGGSAPRTVMVWTDKSEIPPTCILTIDCCACRDMSH